MNHGVDGEEQPGSEVPAPGTPAPASPEPAETAPETAAAAQPPSAFPSGYPHWAAASPPSPPPGAPEQAGSGEQPAPWTPPPSAPPPAAAPWGQPDPWASPSPPPPSTPPAGAGWGAPPWSPAWPPAPATVPPPPLASRRTAALAALLLFAAAAGASAGVVALTTHSSPASSTAQTNPSTPFQPGNGGGDSNSSGTSTGNGANLTQAQIEAKVDPALVDITVTLAGGQGTAEGTGMIVTSNGQVLTNNHVIDGASTIKVQVGGTGSTYNATVVGYDVADDIALLQMQGNPSNLTTIQTGDPNQLTVGDPVVALGNALGRGGTPQPATGSVTALGQTITAGDSSGQTETLSGLIETNANIQPGDSGGPLVNSSGQVIGMDTAASVSGGRFHRIGGTTGQGYAIPIDTAMQIVQQIRSGGGGNSNIQTGQRALIGVEISATATGTGATVAGVQPGSPAESAGIVAGDVITAVGGKSVTSASSLQAAVLTHKPGDRVSVTWVDPSGQQHSATVTLISGPPA
ncbi:MAG TPA: trypsin-like peptidase domain-containing protein [Candidatus Angelobacter sp.]|jgi:S1-C subfamily serine protease|nr:trypsin-like peptidase domain-containing protein [Candidatus Angelobacter sp.]